MMFMHVGMHVGVGAYPVSFRVCLGLDASRRRECVFCTVLLIFEVRDDPSGGSRRPMVWRLGHIIAAWVFPPVGALAHEVRIETL